MPIGTGTIGTPAKARAKVIEGTPTTVESEFQTWLQNEGANTQIRSIQ